MTSPNPEAQSGTETGQGAGDPQGQGTGTNGDATGQSTGAADGTGKPADSSAVSRTEFDQLRNQLRTADQKRADAEKALKDLVEKDLPEQEKLKTRVSELEAANAEKDEALQAARLRLAFLEDNKYKWKNPATALKLADLSAVEFDADGKVRNLTTALDALAKSDPYLLEDKDADSGDSTKGSTGAPSNGTKPTTGPGLAGMASRIPALRTRIGPERK